MSSQMVRDLEQYMNHYLAWIVGSFVFFAVFYFFIELFAIWFVDTFIQDILVPFPIVIYMSLIAGGIAFCLDPLWK